MIKHDELKKEAVANATAMFQNLALIGALAERHLVDPANVADWAEFFAKGMENGVGNGPADPEHLRKVTAQAARLCQAAHEHCETAVPCHLTYFD